MNMLKRPLGISLLCLLCSNQLCQPGPAQAQQNTRQQAQPYNQHKAQTSVAEVEPQEASAALQRAWQLNPRLQSLRREYARAAAQLQQVGLLANPELALTAEDMLGSAAFTPDRFTQFTLEWLQALPLSDRLSRQRQLAELELALLEREYQLALLEVSHAVYLGISRLHSLRQHQQLATERVAHARETARLIAAQLAAGKLPAVADLQARQQVLQQEAELLDLNSQYSQAQLALSRLWGAPPSSNGLTVTGELQPPQALPAFVDFVQRLQQHPRLTRWQLEEERRQQDLQATQTQAVPDLTASGGLRYHPPGDWGVVASLRLPLQLFNSNQGNIAEARLRQQSLQAERDQEWQALLAELQQAYQAYQAEWARWQLLQQQLELAYQAFEIAQKVFTAGKSSYLEVLQSQHSYFAVQRQLLDSHWELEQARLQLQSLSQTLVPASKQPPALAKGAMNL